MRFRIPSFSFRTRVVLLAVLLVAIQLGTLIPVVGSIKGVQEKQARETVDLAGDAYAEYMQNRITALTGIVDVLVKDAPFRESIAFDTGDIEDMLRNHTERVGSLAAAVFDMNGVLRASIRSGSALRSSKALAHFASDPGANEPFHSIAFIDNAPYLTVSLGIREAITAPEAFAWVTLGFPIDETLATDISSLTRLETTFVTFGVGRTIRYATTLEPELREAAFEGVHLGEHEQSVWGTEYITQLRPVLSESDGLYVALQKPMQEAMQHYFALRDVVLVITALALLGTIGAAFWLSRMVTRPIGRLVDAARRMAEGIYSQPITIRTRDEFAVLAQGFNSMQEAIANREQDIVHMAHHDSLSGLPTREIVVGEIRDAINDIDELAVVNFVLHRFDELASSLGHRTADRLIQLVAGRLRDQLGDGQILGHLNHQEFVLALPGADLNEAETKLHEIQSMLRSGLAVGNANISLQVRAGVSLYPDHGINASELMRCAGIARSHASHHLGSFTVYESGQEEKSLELIRIVGDFPKALQNRELWVEYQPKIDCESLALSGAEALVRWEHPKLGRLPPDTFVGAIEQAGGISQLTRWVLEETAATLAAWRSYGLEVSMSVNISADDLMDDYLPSFLKALCARHGLDPRSMTLEVTESTIMHDVESSLEVVTALREQGFRIAIDDFGTGHSALAQLKRLPVDELKIDKSFVLNMGDQRDEAVVRTAIELAHKFGLSAVAEGVEDEACLMRLKQLGCETAQGFFFSKSLRADDFVAWARRWAAGEGADIVTLVGSRNSPRRLRQ